MSALRGIVVGHATLGAALVSAVEQIAGPTDGLVAISNADCDRGTLEDRILTAVAGGPAVVFIDMPSGSCLFAAMRRLQSVSGVRVVTGVNLAMLLEFVFHREEPVDEVARRVAEAGARAVTAR
jgi:mannose/fructose-specific phosphotransferase system component IIA